MRARPGETGAGSGAAGANRYTARHGVARSGAAPGRDHA